MRSLPYFLLLLAIQATAAQHENPHSGWTFAGFESVLTRVSFDVVPHSAEDQAISSISSSLDKIRNAYLGKYGNDADTEQSLGKHLAAEYSRSMVDDIAALNNLPSGQAARLTVIEDVRDDLAIKARFLPQTSALASSVFPSIVHLSLRITLPAGSTVNPSSLSIRANPHYFGTRPPPAYILANGVGPQTGQLPPGRFWVWVEANGKVLQAQERDLGMDGATSADINLALDKPVP